MQSFDDVAAVVLCCAACQVPVSSHRPLAAYSRTPVVEQEEKIVLAL